MEQVSSSSWKEHRNGNFYSDWDELAMQEPMTIALLKKEAGTQAETDQYILTVYYHVKYGWSVGRQRKNNQEQKMQHISLQPQTPASIQLELQELKKQSTTITNILETRFAEVSEILQCLDKKIDQKLTTAITTQQGENE